MLRGDPGSRRRLSNVQAGSTQVEGFGDRTCGYGCVHRDALEEILCVVKALGCWVVSDSVGCLFMEQFGCVSELQCGLQDKPYKQDVRLTQRVQAVVTKIVVVCWTQPAKEKLAHCFSVAGVGP